MEYFKNHIIRSLYIAIHNAHIEPVVAWRVVLLTKYHRILLIYNAQSAGLIHSKEDSRRV